VPFLISDSQNFPYQHGQSNTQDLRQPMDLSLVPSGVYCQMARHIAARAPQIGIDAAVLEAVALAEQLMGRALTDAERRELRVGPTGIVTWLSPWRNVIGESK
jgi:hypothetical protein